MSRQTPLLPRKLSIVHRLPPPPPPLARRPPLGPRKQRTDESQTNATTAKLVVAPMPYEPAVTSPVATAVAEAKQKSHVQEMEEVPERILKQVNSYSVCMSLWRASFAEHATVASHD